MISPGKRTDAKPKMKIAEIIRNENLESLQEMDRLRLEIQQYLQTNMINRLKSIEDPDNKQLTPELLDTYFRSHERQENTKRLLQYMLAFLANIPEPNQISQEPVNPVSQFKEFVQYQVGLLKEKDVIQAITREFNRQNMHEQDNNWFYEARIMDKRLELELMLKEVRVDSCEMHLLLFQVLENLSLFWFEIGREDVRQARRSDIYVYKLSRLLQNKLKNNKTQAIAARS